ncbi:MAG TPA: GNAT family protein [Fermentimonas sp.]|nr:GNAT family protein [Fermentimonas sp.]
MKKKIRVYLRALEPEDYSSLHKWRNDEEIGHSFSGRKLFTSTLNEKKWIEERIFDKENVSCAICLKETDEFIGCIFLNNIDFINRSGHCPTFIGEKKHWGKGYATEARILMLRFAFYEKGLERIWANVHEDNLGSLKMLEKCGYKKEGVLRKSSFVNGVFKNYVVLSVLRDEFDVVAKEYDL